MNKLHKDTTYKIDGLPVTRSHSKYGCWLERRSKRDLRTTFSAGRLTIIAMMLSALAARALISAYSAVMMEFIHRKSDFELLSF